MGISLMKWLKGGGIQKDPSVPKLGGGGTKSLKPPYKASMKNKLGREKMRVGPPPSPSHVPPMRERRQKRTVKNFYGAK
jgi:hypothetical protein